jgi:hypothetical protein
MTYASTGMVCRSGLCLTIPLLTWTSRRKVCITLFGGLPPSLEQAESSSCVKQWRPTLYTVDDEHPVATCSGSNFPDGQPVPTGERTYSHTCTMKVLCAPSSVCRFTPKMFSARQLRRAWPRPRRILRDRLKRLPRLRVEAASDHGNACGATGGFC